MKIIISIYLMLFLLAPALAQEPKYAGYEWDNIPFSSYNLKQYGEENIIILASKYCAEYFYGNMTKDLEMFITVHNKYLVLKEQALDEVCKFSISLPDDGSIVELNARFITKNGKVTEILKDKIETVEDEKGVNNFKIFDIEEVSAPGIVEYYYIIRRPFIIQDSYYCQWQMPACNVSFELYSPKNLQFLFKTYNDTPPVEVSYSEDSTMLYNHLFLESVPSLQQEQMALNKANYKRITYSLAYNYDLGTMPIRTLENAATYFYEAFLALDKKNTKLLSNALKKIPLKNLTEEKKIHKIEVWVKNHVNFVNTSDERAGNLEFILKNNMANNNGFSRLLSGLYKVAGIPFEFVISCDKNDYYFDSDFDAWNYLEDALLYFPNINKYLKPDVFEYRLGYFPTKYQNNYGLFLKTNRLGGKESLRKTVRYIEPVPLLANMDTMYIKAFVSESGDQVNCQVKRMIYGDNAAILQANYDLVDEDAKKTIQEVFVKFGDNAVVEKCIVKNTNQEDVLIKPFHFEAEVNTDLINIANERYVVYIGEFIGNRMELYSDKQRRQPVDLKGLHGYYRDIEFTIPDGFHCDDISALNMDVTLDDGTGISARFTSKAEIVNNILKIVIVEFYDKMEYPVEMYDAFKAVTNAAADFTKVTVAMEK
jgi:hypothetical protein